MTERHLFTLDLEIEKPANLSFFAFRLISVKRPTKIMTLSKSSAPFGGAWASPRCYTVTTSLAIAICVKKTCIVAANRLAFFELASLLMVRLSISMPFWVERDTEGRGQWKKDRGPDSLCFQSCRGWDSQGLVRKWQRGRGEGKKASLLLLLGDRRRGFERTWKKDFKVRKGSVGAVCLLPCWNGGMGKGLGKRREGEGGRHPL